MSLLSMTLTPQHYWSHCAYDLTYHSYFTPLTLPLNEVKLLNFVPVNKIR